MEKKRSEKLNKELTKAIDIYGLTSAESDEIYIKIKECELWEAKIEKIKEKRIKRKLQLLGGKWIELDYIPFEEIDKIINEECRKVGDEE